jgi:hypothetical protein
MIPMKMLSYRENFPIFEEASEWQLLRKWKLSEVYRITFPTGDTQIVKWGGEEMAREMDIYSQLLGPLRIRSPQIYGYHKNNDGGLIIMEDAGERDLEQQPMEKYFLEAAKELARLRITAANSLESGTIPNSVRNAFTVTREDFLGQLEDLIHSPLLNDDPILQRVHNWLPEQLNQLYQEVPLTLVHHDYHAKNLLVQRDRILPIDWSNAYLSPHLGDLYSLMLEAQSFCGLSGNEIMDAYLLECLLEEMNKENLFWQLKIGGLCWLIRSLRWLVYGGTNMIPGSEAWIPDLFADMGKLLDDRIYDPVDL